jgi:hypothetical protein
VFPTLPVKRTFTCDLGKLPVAASAAGEFWKSILEFVQGHGYLRFAVAAERQHVELQTDRELSMEEAAVVMGFCVSYDDARARAYPS